MTKYGRTDPAEFQLRDIKRRLTAEEKRLQRLITKVLGMGRAIEDLQHRLVRVEGYDGPED